MPLFCLPNAPSYPNNRTNRSGISFVSLLSIPPLTEWNVLGNVGKKTHSKLRNYLVRIDFHRSTWHRWSTLFSLLIRRFKIIVLVFAPHERVDYSILRVCRDFSITIDGFFHYYFSPTLSLSLLFALHSGFWSHTRARIV